MPRYSSHKSRIKILNEISSKNDEILIIKVYNKANGRDEYIIAEKVNGSIETRQTESIDDISIDRPFRIIKQRNESGKFEIPSVKQMEHDKLIDY